MRVSLPFCIIRNRKQMDNNQWLIFLWNSLSKMKMQFIHHILYISFETKQIYTNDVYPMGA